MLIELREQGLSDQEIIQYAIEHLSMSIVDADFILAMESGEIDGDVVLENKPRDYVDPDQGSDLMIHQEREG